MNIAILGKLSDKHVDLNSFSKMRVHFAIRFLSQSIASGIRIIAILTGRRQTFVNLFDIFN